MTTWKRLPRGLQGVQGERGAQGNQGNRGQQGELSRKQGTAVVYLFGVTMLLVVAGMFVLFHYVREVAKAERTAEHATAVASRVDAAAHAQRCADLGKLAAIPVPTPVTGHESRQFAAAEEAIWRARARQIGCTVRSTP